MRDGWVETKLGDVVKLGKGGSWGQDSPAEFLSEVICLRGTDVADLIEKKIPTAPTRWAKESELKKSRCQPNMVVIETSGSKCGRSIVLTEEILGLFPLPVIYSNFCRTLEIATEIVSNHYIELWFSHNYQNGLIPSYRATSAMPNLDVKALLRVESILIPPLPEQKRIVDLISSVDSYIEALQHHLESVRKSRNALIHDLLNRVGDDWVDTKIGAVSGFVQIRVAPKDLSSDSIYVGLEHLEPFTSSISRFDSVSKVSSSLTPFEPGDVLFGRLRPYLHKVALAEIGGFCSPEILVLRANSEILSKMLFLYCDLDSTIQACVEKSAGTRMPRASVEDLQSIEIELPPRPEQERIAGIVSAYDSEIRQISHTLSRTANVRAALLSDLLSGNHEIPASYDQLIGAA